MVRLERRDTMHGVCRMHIVMSVKDTRESCFAPLESLPMNDIMKYHGFVTMKYHGGIN